MQGYTKFQLKVGSSVEEDVGRIRAVASVLKNGEILMADANTGCKYCLRPKDLAMGLGTTS